MWNLPPPPGFQGLRDDLPLQVYYGALPHWRQEGATYFVTFRLGDSLPQSKLRELRRFKAEWQRKHPHPRPKAVLDDLSREVMRRVEDWLDQGLGSCVLRAPAASQIVANVILKTHGLRAEVGCFVVMPNHVHAIVRPLDSGDDPLEQVLKSWKGATARRINERAGDEGSLWQRESFDRIIRDEEHLWRVIQYIGRNPRSANLLEGEYVLWINPEWVKLGWIFEPATNTP